MMRSRRAALTTLLLGLQQALLIPFLSLFAVRELGLPPLGLFAFLTGFHGTGLVVSLLVPALMDRFGKGGLAFRALTTCAAVGFAVLALPTNAAIALVVAGVLLGPASAQNSVFFAALKTSGTSRSGLLSTRGVFTVAWVAGPAFGALLTSVAGFTGLFVVLSLLNVLVLLVSPVRRLDTSPIRAGVSEGAGAAPTRPHLVWAAFGGLVCLYGTNVIATTTMPIVMTGLPGGNATLAGLAFGLSAAVEGLVLFCFARWSTQKRERTVILLACVPGALYYTVLATTGAPWAILAGQLPNAVFISAAVGLGMTWFQSLMPTRQGLATGLFMNASRIASLGTAPLIAGATAVTGSYQAVNLIATALLIPAVLLILAVRKSKSSAGDHERVSPSPARDAAGGERG